MILSDADVKATLRLDRLVDLQREAFVSTATGTGLATQRTGLEVAEGALKVASMAALAPDGQTVTTKVLASAHGNRARGLPRSSSTLVVMDVPTGRVRAILEGTYLTNARTAAAAVLAMETLRADLTEVPYTVGLFGAGPIAELILTILASREGPWRVHLYAPTERHRSELALRAYRDLGLDVRSVADPGEAAAAPQVIFATDGRRSAVSADALAPHGVVVSIASRREVAEIPTPALIGAALVVDERSAAVRETGEFRETDPVMLLELGELLTGQATLPAAGERTRRVFKATGLAVQDAVVCSHLLAQMAS